ncbi:MAG TPA: TrkH family potassium uptake protein [Bacillota bacterium]|nr:TrkH family potassium uptake protein [Bacillota bacterium]
MRKYTHPRLHWTKHLSPVRMLVLFYSLAALISSIILSLPFVYQDGVSISLIDTIFVAVSALSVTGLTPVSIADTFNTFGIIIISIILQLGMLGIMAIGTSIWLLLGRRIGLQERRLIMADQNRTSLSGMGQLIKQIVLLLIVIQLISFLMLGTYFLTYFSSTGEAYLHGFFATISALSNGGFDITGNSLVPYRQDYFVQCITMILIVFGAIGFPVLIEVKEYLFTRKKERKSVKFSLFTKLTTVTFAILIVVGAVGVYLLDMNHYFQTVSWHEKIFHSLFQSITTRSAGLTVFDVNELTSQNHLFISLLMFIGASPSSAGGGIRTTTFALVVLFIVMFARGGKNVVIFSREVYNEDMKKAIVIMIMAIALMFVSVLILTIAEADVSLRAILFEVMSAFGTVGLSLGITSKLSSISKIVLMILMFIGRVGVITFLYIFKNNRRQGRVRYPKERIIIG